MKYRIIASLLIIYANCLSQGVILKNDTLLKKEFCNLTLDNGFAIPPFEVSGTLYLTNNQLIFSPKPFRRKRYEMYNDLIKSINLSYDSILRVKRRGILGFGIKIRTRTKIYKFYAVQMKPQSTINLINQLKASHKNA
ncbi:MAG: GRAM domain-containing protein, partial [Cyclobacteriaceae bacterium]|nr:GRAM domain-containing protein [Cyclobacteriaceae bacterium]